MKRILSFLLCVCMALSLLPEQALAQSAEGVEPDDSAECSVSTEPENEEDSAIVKAEKAEEEAVEDTKRQRLAAALKDKTVSILGDSISTFGGVSDNSQYPQTLNQNIGFYPLNNVTTRTETWWQQVTDALGMELGVNNSSDGSRILSDAMLSTNSNDTFSSSLRNTMVIASGKCGSTITWTLDSAGKLTISGTGAMYNYWKKENVPWYSHRESIKTLVVESGVTQIGMYAFYGCEYLTSVSLPEGLTSIGKYAFMSCERLPAITIPSSVTTILNEAFGYCDALKNVVLPDGLTEVGIWLFFGCISLESVTIPDSVTEICDSAFACCYKLKSIDIPDSVRSIGDSAFFTCETLKTVTIP